VLDGFPRTAAQAGMLESLAERQEKKLKAILIDVPQDLLEKRMTGRRSCPVCGEIYNIYFKPPRMDCKCDAHPEADLVRRADDTEEKVRVRLDTYNRETAPLLEYYKRTGRLHRVDGTREPDEIHAEIRRIVNGGSVSTAIL
jgi:adenylate kinase